MNYYGISDYYRPVPEIDKWIRRRIRTHEGPPPSRLGDQQTPSHLYSDQSQELLALVEGLVMPFRLFEA